MTYPQSIDLIRSGSSNTCMIFSTKDRVDLTRKTYRAVTAEGDFDLIWMDGSNTKAGCALPATLGPTKSQLTEIHYGVTGGPDAAILYGLSYALSAGYASIGLIENDVMLADGWFKASMDLFSRGAIDGLKVGAVTARPFDRRTLWQTSEYSVHFGSGAGMIIFSREAAQVILKSYRTTTYTEIQEAFRSTGAPNFMSWSEVSHLDLRRQNLNATSADWYFDSALIKKGMVVLGTVPGYAENIDTDMQALLGISVTQSPERDDADLAAFKNWKASLSQNIDDQAIVYSFDSNLGLWIVYPHQVAACFPSAITGAWRMKWHQTCGPFSLVAEGADAKISLPIEGSMSVVLGPESKWPRRLARVGLPARSVYQDRWKVMCTNQKSNENDRYILENPSIGTELVAFAFESIQHWMHEPPEFRFEHIARFFHHSQYAARI